MDITIIQKLCSEHKLRWTDHIFKRLVQRNISMDDVQKVILNGEIIENYPDDYPYPSCLILGFMHNNNALHVVCAPDEESEVLWLITAYFPDSRWESDFKTRKVE